MSSTLHVSIDGPIREKRRIQQPFKHSLRSSAYASIARVNKGRIDALIKKRNLISDAIVQEVERHSGSILIPSQIRRQKQLQLLDKERSIIRFIAENPFIVDEPLRVGDAELNHSIGRTKQLREIDGSFRHSFVGTPRHRRDAECAF